MTETLATYQLDSMPVADLMKRYELGKTQFYERVNGLELEFEKRGNRSFATAVQIDKLDALHDYLKKSGNTIAGFVESLGEPSSKQSGQLERASNPAASMLTLTEMIVSRIPQPPSDPLAHIRMLDEACEKKWKLSTSELCALLKRQSIAGNEVRKYGFICIRAGRNGSESAWKIERE